MKRHEDGYRYVRQYTVRGGERRWAAWVRIEGRMRRVGTFLNQRRVTAFLFHLDPEEIATP